ncbi:Hypp7993 [Branchiostoma lanceolatum]|uniref:Hypp7993 protein n=1 Tax=Branchiostoma lanceolatum TaxID=7740 RepID=A0A8K0EC90_BRALA|nr:Hypp7993 [Branchiostoma lanceolatum]
MKIAEPAYLRLVPNVTANRTGYDLVIATFSSVPFTVDHVQYVPDVGRHLDDPANWSPRLITNRPRFPNEVNIVPDDVFQQPGVLSVASGFFSPTKTHGSVDLLQGWAQQEVSPVTISSQASGEEWFYHRVEWADMNGDGRKDALTARANFNPLDQLGLEASSKSQLVWFEQPSSYPALSPSWNGHLIADCADLFFRSANLNVGGKNKTVIFSAGYFSKRLCVTWTEDQNGDWSDVTKVRTTTIDDELGVYFSVEVADMNSDSRLDLLVTVNSPDNGTVLVYEIPDDVTKGPWERRVISDGFSVPGLFKQGKGSPGFAVPFYPSVANSAEKPSILVSGYDDGHAYILSPASQSSTDWSYELTTFHAGHGVIGNGFQLGDVDGDGTQELFLPCYSEGQVIVYQVIP